MPLFDVSKGGALVNFNCWSISRSLAASCNTEEVAWVRLNQPIQNHARSVAGVIAVPAVGDAKLSHIHCAISDAACHTAEACTSTKNRAKVRRAHADQAETTGRFRLAEVHPAVLLVRAQPAHACSATHWHLHTCQVPGPTGHDSTDVR